MAGWAPPLVLAVLYAATYHDATGAFFHFDDYWVLADSAAVRLDGPLDIAGFFVAGRNGFVLYRPLSTLIYFRLLRALFGYDAAGYHAVQIAFHTANALLVYGIGRLVLESRWRALAAAILYAVAPGHAIAVFWMALFTMTGTAFWYLAGLYAWLRLRGLWRVAVTGGLFLAALGSAEHAVSFPLALTLTLLILDGRWPSRRDVAELAPFFVLAGGYVAAKVYYFAVVFPHAFPGPAQQIAVQYGYAMTANPVALLEHTGRYAAFALNLLFPLVAPAGGESPLAFWLGLFVALAFVGAIVAARPGRAASPPVRAAAFGLGLFFISLAPVIGLANHVYGYYVGIAGAGLAYALIGMLGALPRASREATAAVAALALAMHVGVTWRMVRSQPDMVFFREFSRSAARWLYTIGRVVQAEPTVKEIAIPRDPLTSMVFDDTGAHRLLLPYPLEVRTVEEGATEQPGSGRRMITAPYVFPAGQPWPGRRPEWDWLRWPNVS
jgi:hypothetical protein